MSETTTTRPPPTSTERLNEKHRLAELHGLAQTKAGPAPITDNRESVQQAAKATAQAVGSCLQTMAGAASQFTIRQYLAILARLAGFAGLFVVYQTIEATGLREMFGEVVSQRLAKACPSLLGWMDAYRETRKLDLANGVAVALLVFSYASWEVVTRRIVLRSAHPLGERYIVLVPASVLMLFDTVLFAVGVHLGGSFNSYAPAVMLALAYDSMLMLFAYWIVKLEGRGT